MARAQFVMERLMQHTACPTLPAGKLDEELKQAVNDQGAGGGGGSPRNPRYDPAPQLRIVILKLIILIHQLRGRGNRCQDRPLPHRPCPQKDGATQ